jgi:hypothetical protein
MRSQTMAYTSEKFFKPTDYPLCIPQSGVTEANAHNLFLHHFNIGRWLAWVEKIGTSTSLPLPHPSLWGPSIKLEGFLSLR